LSFREREERSRRERDLARNRDDLINRALVIDDRDHVRSRVAKLEREESLCTTTISRDQSNVTSLSSLVVHDRRDNLARQARELS